MIVRRRFFRIFALVAACTVAGQARAAEELLTVAERSDYKATARHEEVLDFCKKLAERRPRVKLLSLGQSAEGRDLPLLVIADPPVADAAAAKDSKKMIVFAMANIHAGEVCGKEALLMLARELSQDQVGKQEDTGGQAASGTQSSSGTHAAEGSHPLLKELIFVIAPIFNADGNERVDVNNRPGQLGPEQGMGIRENAQGFDLNRDHTKLEAPETRALARFLGEWDPAVVIDTHTTNGSYHRYTITYDGPRHPAADSQLVKYVRDALLPAAGKRLQAASGYKSFFYGNFDRAHSRWDMYPALPRYNTQYLALRNRIGILCEAYAYAPYKDRVLATRGFVGACLEECAANKGPIAELLEQARQRTTTQGDDTADVDTVPLRFEDAALPNKFKVLGYEEELREGRPVKLDAERDYEVDFYWDAKPTLAVARPYAYLLPPNLTSVVENLKRHGIEVRILREDVELDVEAYRVTRLARDSQQYQQHHLLDVEVAAERKPRRMPAGTLLVRSGQPLGTLAVHLLEPSSPDGLCAWNFLDEHVRQGDEFPILRMMEAAPLLTAMLPKGDKEDTLKPERQHKQPITHELLWSKSPPNLHGSPAAGFEWLEDGEHYLQVKEDKLYKVHAASGKAERFLDPAQLQKALADLPTIDDKAAEKLAGTSRFHMNPARNGALFEHEQDLYFAAFDGSRAVRLTATPQREELAEFSPDGGFVSFVRDFDLYVVDLATQTERALTTGGSDLVRHGMADWVYFEEIYNRNWKGYRWSPDSRHIAVMEYDDSPVGNFTVIDEIPVRQRRETARYPKAGDPNPHVKLGVVSVAGGPVRWMELADYPADGTLITHYGFTPDSQSVYFYVQDRAQTWLDVHKAGVGETTAAKLLRDQTKAWVENPGDARFLKDGSFLLASERDGWRHLYHFEPDGQLRRQVTQGEWEVRDIAGLDEAGGFVYFSGSKDSHIADNFYRARIDGSQVERLTTAPGTHAVSLSPKFNLFVDTFSDCKSPIQVVLRRGDGAQERTLDINPVPDLAKHQLSPVELVQIPARDGFVMEGLLIKPPGFDATKKYPVWFMTYGGPHAPTVIDSWQAGRTFDQALAAMGVVVFRADPRSASGKGAVSTWTAYRQMGMQELKDVEDMIGWLKGHAWVDGERIGMSGTSYGGYLTAFCMTRGKLFAAGVSGAPVTDWRNYDTIYTERYMNTPQQNPDGYKETSIVRRAKDLHGRLLLVHGQIDDNVHVQNTLQLALALQRENKQFELMIYPQSRHGGFGSHYQRLMVDFIKRSLGL